MIRIPSNFFGPPSGAAFGRDTVVVDLLNEESPESPQQIGQPISRLCVGFCPPSLDPLALTFSRPTCGNRNRRMLMNDEIIKEFVHYPNRCYAGQSTARHCTHDVKLFPRWCQRPIAEVTPQDVDSYVGNELVRGLSKATINRRLASS